MNLEILHQFSGVIFSKENVCVSQWERIKIKLYELLRILTPRPLNFNYIQHSLITQESRGHLLLIAISMTLYCSVVPELFRSQDYFSFFAVRVTWDCSEIALICPNLSVIPCPRTLALLYFWFVHQPHETKWPWKVWINLMYWDCFTSIWPNPFYFASKPRAARIPKKSFVPFL